MKTFSIILISILIIVLGFITGIYLYKINHIGDEEPQDTLISSKVEDECTTISELQAIGSLDTEMANASEEKVSPSSVLTIKKLYMKCNHIIENSDKIDVELANLNKEELQEKYEEWEIQKFTGSEIILYKEENDFCNEHYSLKDINGYIGIYELDENDNEVKLIKVTDISTEYLTETDLIKIENGMKVHTKKELNRVIEDFE